MCYGFLIFEIFYFILCFSTKFICLFFYFVKEDVFTIQAISLGEIEKIEISIDNSGESKCNLFVIKQLLIRYNLIKLNLILN